MPLVFQYGSNCDAGRLNSTDRLAGAARDLGGVRTLENYDIAFNKWSARGGYAAADLIKPRTGGRGVWGVLYELSRSAFAKLKTIEGPSYRASRITVEDMRGTRTRATTFRVRRTKRRRQIATSAEYVGHIVHGLRVHQVPEDYVQRVLDVAVHTNRSARAPADAENRAIELLRRR